MRIRTLRASTFQEPAPAGVGWLRGFLSSTVYNSAVLAGVIPVGTRIGSWISRLIALPQLRRLAAGDIPWAPLRKPLGYSAWIEQDGSSERIPCYVANESEQGAQITTLGPPELQNAFMLYSRSGRVRRKCEVVWRGQNVTGVRFLKTVLNRDATNLS